MKKRMKSILSVILAVSMAIGTCGFASGNVNAKEISEAVNDVDSANEMEKDKTNRENTVESTDPEVPVEDDETAQEDIAESAEEEIPEEQSDFTDSENINTVIESTNTYTEEIESEEFSNSTGTPNDILETQDNSEITTVSDSDIINSGTCGDNLEWVLTGDGTLTISGNGGMYDFRDPNYYVMNAPWYEKRDSILSVVLKNGVTSIGNCAFEGCINLISIEIPDSVTNIGSDSFLYCSSLASIEIPENVTNIGAAAFLGCSSLTSIEIPDGVTSIERETFRDCSNLINIEVPDGVTNIGVYAFDGCSNLASIEIPDSVTSIDDFAFVECSSLTSIEIPDGVRSIGRDTFRGCSNLKSIEIPDSLISIESFAFKNCSSLISIEIPDGVTIIGGAAFYDCSSLTSINIPTNVTSIEEDVFFGCSSLKNIELPDSITSIGNNAFYKCSSLTSINIPESVKSIGHSAFGGCSCLANIIKIPENVTSIENDVFSGCSSLKNIELPDSITSIGDSAFSGCSSLTSINIPEGLTVISDRAFSGCSSLTSVKIPEGVTNLGIYSFGGCSSLTSVKIPEGVTNIGVQAFDGCSNLASIEIPDSVTSIGYGAFCGCASLSNIAIPEGITSIGNQVFRKCSSLTSIEIPKSVTSIGQYAFSECNGLVSIEIPDSVTSIGEYAFSECNGLVSIEIPDSVTSIGEYAFSECNSLVNIEIPGSVTNIGKSAFEGCSNLTSVKILDGVASIDNNAFEDCSSLTSIEISDNVTSIGTGAFSGCSSLVSIEIPNGVTNVNDIVFLNCRNLLSIKIPEGVTRIGGKAFFQCSSLKSVIIPKTVTSIESFAFADCNSLTNVYYGGSEQEWSAIGILNNSELTGATIHYNSIGTGNDPVAGSNPLYDGNLVIKTFTGWDEENKTASFDDGIDYCTNEDTDLSFLDSLNELIGQKVLVVENKSEILTIKGIYPVEEVVGKVSQWGTSSIILNGEQYPAAEDWFMNETLVDTNHPVRCYIHEGTIVGVEIPQKKTGILNGWKTPTSEITIGDETYIVDIDDLTFLNYLQLWMGQTIEYTLFDNKVIDIEFPDYYQRYTAKVEEYNEETGEVYFSDDQYYFIAEDFEESPSDYIGKWVNYSVRTSQDQGTYLSSLSLIKSELIVTLEIDPDNVFYKDDQYSSDSETFVDRSDFEIPYFVTVKNKTNAYSNKLIKEDPQFDISINDVEMELPSGFNFGWLNEGKIHGNGKVIHAGDAATAEGYIRPGIWYNPKELTNTYDVSCTVVSSAGEGSSKDTFTVTVKYSDADTDTLTTEAAQALDDLSDNITMQMDDSFFDQDTTNRIAQALFSIAVMAKAEPEDMKESLTEDLFDQVFGDWKLKTGTNSYDVPIQIAVKTKEYGELIFEFKMHMHSYNINGSNYGLWGSIDYDIVGGKGLDDVPGHLRHQSTVGTIAKGDVTAFCNAAYELAEKEIKKSYDMAVGDGLNKVADIVFGQTVKQIMEKADTSFSDILFKIITTPGKSVALKCPVDIYLYDETGELEASIVNNQIEKESDSIELEVIGDTKVITFWDGAYDLKLVSNGTGNMDITVTEYAGVNNILRVVDFYDIPLGNNIEYSAEVQPDLLVDDYILVDNQSEKITSDKDETILENLEPGDVEEHVHVYGEPDFNWSVDYQTCTAVFTCESGDDEQKIECAISSKTTEPTCTEDGKMVYTATAIFADKEYTDTQEEIISATGHTYEYTDNGNGTHTKACTAGDDTVTEPHTYQDGICTVCGAEEPAGHVHKYGEPKFTWSNDYSSCSAIFTCLDGDDQQTVVCVVTSKDNGDGTVSYNAVAEFNGESYTAQQTVDVNEGTAVKPDGKKPTESGNGTGPAGDKTSEETASGAQTGDDSNPVLWSLLIASMLSAGGILLLIQKKKYVKR